MATQANQAMTSEVSICNQALTWVGANPITSLNERSNAAEWCRNNYPFIRDAVIQERTWTFATVRAVSTTADRDEWDTTYAHQVPLNWLSVFRVNRRVTLNGQVTPDISWRLEGGKVLSRWDTIYLWGLITITDTGKFPPVFVQALAARLAAEMSVPLAKNRQLQADNWGLYGDKMREAAARDGQQGANDYVTQHKLIDARYSGGYF